MNEAIKNFPKQFEYEPKIENEGALKRKPVFIVAGMGGSHLAGDIIQAALPNLDIVIHSDYGLFGISESVLENSMLIASSYSGNTEEVLSAFGEAKKCGLPLAAISVGGKLLEIAKSEGVPYIELPDTGIQPRSALGFSVKALLKIIGKEVELNNISSLSGILRADELETKGKEIAEALKGKVPVIYSSTKNRAVAYNWKIKFNETGKIPAFYNVFPELNHNEMTGFDYNDQTRPLSQNFYFIFIKDPADHPKIIKRMEATKKLYEARGFACAEFMLSGASDFEKIFKSLLLADWASYYTAVQYGAEAEQVPMVEEFKKLV